MTSLVVQPIRLDEPGSYRQRRQFVRLIKRLKDGQATKDADAVLATLEEADELVRSRLRTDDGSPIDDALALLSANQFDELLSAIAFESGMGEASTLTSTGGSEVSQVPSLPTG